VSGGAVSAALLAALREREGALPVERIDQVWLFPPRQVGTADSSLAVLSLFAVRDPIGRREILTLHCTAPQPQNRRVPLEIRLVEQGSAPVERLEPLIHGVLQRLRDAPQVPRSVQISGSRERWEKLLAEGAGMA
jgi:hypothetical protein